jgi:hypothetical protein
MSTLTDLKRRYAPAATPATFATPAEKVAEVARVAGDREAERNTPAHRAHRRAQARARLVRRLLRHHPDLLHYYYTDDRADPRYIILTIGLQGVGTADIWIPRESYDPFRVLEIVHGKTLEQPK